ncbi:MAG: MaoC family dehydratase N-terminal domain-containing protein [Peptococcaceae bacterium]|nr:MaoC family dehydratase N-terminal domain-containing protein [Peptococcaceae bacterium]
MAGKNVQVGRELANFSFTVERGKIREFVQAIGDPNPVYTDSGHARAEGYRDVIAPPTFGTAIEFWGGNDFMAKCRELEMDPVKVLHGEQEYLYFGEINAGDVIKARQRLAGFEEKKSMYLFILETEYVNQRGEKVLVSRSTVIERK